MSDLLTALAAVVPGWRVELCAVDRDGLTYGPPVRSVLRQDDAGDYRSAADAIAAGGCDLVLIEHEYGIFGGPDGAYLLNLTDRLGELGVPYAVTLHTVVGNPTPGQESVLRRLCAGAALVTVFTETARRMLADAGTAAPDRVAVVAHGAPEVLRRRVDLARLRPVVAEALAEPGTARRSVLSTFGLIGPGKGLEVALAALPEVAARHPGVRYLIVGATHPEEVRRHGERYREGLQTLVERLGVARHVRFVDTYLTDLEMSALLAGTDLYVTPYLSSEQICSGTLTFAVAAGCPVVSTAYRYAQDLLAPDPGGAAPGVLVPCGDPAALAAGINQLLAEPAELARARRAAHERGATLMWPVVASRLTAVLAAAAGSTAPAARPAAHGGPRQTAHSTPTSGRATARLAHRLAPMSQPDRAQPHRRHSDGVPPGEARLDHLRRLTDDNGIIQFARGSEPDPESGYCVDDVARLGIVALGLGESRWLATSIAFLTSAMGPGGMRNVRGLDGRWRDEPHLGDHVGRAIWAIGSIASAPVPQAERRRARALLQRVVPLVNRLAYLRSSAYAVLGLAGLAEPGPRERAALIVAARRLMAADAGIGDWCWFEARLTYDNARLPQALIAAGSALDDSAMVHRGLSTLDWYLSQVGLTGAEPVLRCVGNAWRVAGASAGEEGDEQPLDAAAAVEALALAWRRTGDQRYARLAIRAHAWFHGVNRAGQPLYDALSGGCHDGLYADGVNPNMGAESTLAYHQSLLALARAGLVRPAAEVPHGTR